MISIFEKKPDGVLIINIFSLADTTAKKERSCIGSLSDVIIHDDAFGIALNAKSEIYLNIVFPLFAYMKKGNIFLLPEAIHRANDKWFNHFYHISILWKKDILKRI